MTDTKKPRQRKKSTTVKDMLGLWDVTHQRVDFLRDDLDSAEKELRAVEAFLEATAPIELAQRKRETNGSCLPPPSELAEQMSNAAAQSIRNEPEFTFRPRRPEMPAPKHLTIETPSAAPITDMDNGQ